MNTLNINLVGIRPGFRPYLVVDGKNLSYKKNQYGTYDAVYSTQKDVAEILVYKYLEIRGRLWWLMSLVFFFISVFGIFDTRYDKKCMVVDCRYTVALKEQSFVRLNFYPMVNHARAAEISSDCLSVEETKNLFYVDKIAKKRQRIMLAVKLLIWLAMIVTGILVMLSHYGAI